PPPDTPSRSQLDHLTIATVFDRLPPPLPPPPPPLPPRRPRQRFQRAGQRGHTRVLEQNAERQVDSRRGAQLREESRRHQGVAAQIEKGLAHTEIRPLQHALEHAHHHLLRRRAR